MVNYKQVIESGKDKLVDASVVICSIVRDCNKQLKVNIPVIESFRKYCKSSSVIVFENDSLDGTKETLINWQNSSKHVFIDLKDFNELTIPNNTEGVNRFFSAFRIEKMAFFRNQYLSKLNSLEEKPDYVIVVDMDVKKINVEGILHSFGLAKYWDVVTAFGYSRSVFGGYNYYDTYALNELGTEQYPQTEASIEAAQNTWGFLRKGMPLMPVYSAYGGLSIYKYQVIKDCNYSAIPNNDIRVEVRCEHFGLCHAIRQKGFERIYVNPSMVLQYQGVNFDKWIRSMKRVWRRLLK